MKTIKLFGQIFNGNTACYMLLVILFAFFSLSSCKDKASKYDNEYLIRVRNRVVTVSDFNKALEIAKSAYPHNIEQSSILFKKAQFRMFNQMIEELLVMEQAEELQINLTESEVESAIANIKKDYPEGVFEEMLLEYAVSYRFWKDRLKIRLLIEKVVAKELVEKITITPEDIAKYYKENFRGKVPVSDSDETKDVNELIIKQLRRNKAEEAYKDWIKNLKEKYSVEINGSQWERITSFKGN
jgi:hypothetical protein